MPSIHLTDRFLASKSAPTNYFDTHTKGLTLRVTAGGGKLWSFVYRVQGKGPQWITMGSYPTLKLAKAREAAGALRYQVDVEKRDPVAERKAAAAAALVPPPVAAPVMTVRIFASAFVKFQKGKKKTWDDDEEKVNAYIVPAWGDLPVTDVTRKMVADLLTDITGRGLTIGVNRIQACISRFFAVAVNQGLRDGNPAARLIKRFKETPRTRVLTEKEIRTLHAELEARPSEAADVFWLRLLLGQRAEETGGMRWSELDLETRTWFLDGVRTKNGVEDLLWLPDLALAVITRRRAEVAEDATYVFPAIARERQPKVQRDISTAVAALFPKFNWKDLRRTVSTGLGELGFDDGTIDRLLNHKAATVGRRHYNHAKYLPEKQAALSAWDREITRILEGKPKTSRVLQMPAR